jgi:hypothetical protein
MILKFKYVNHTEVVECSEFKIEEYKDKKLVTTYNSRGVGEKREISLDMAQGCFVMSEGFVVDQYLILEKKDATN